MRQLHSVAIIGAGAMGLLYAASLKKVPQTPVYFLADGNRFERLKAGEFVVNGESIHIDVRPMGDAGPPADLLIVATKTHHLHSIIPLLRAAADSHTVVISVLNGIQSELFLEKECPGSTVLYCIGLGMDAVHDATGLAYSTPGKLIIGSTENNREHPELLATCDLLDRAQVIYEIPADIHRELWWKWMVNIGMNQVSAVTGATYGTFQMNSEIQALMEAAMREAVAVAQSEGVDLRDADIAEWYAVLNSLGAAGKTSMLQDMQAGRRTEVPSFGGRLIELAAHHGIPVPVNETLVRVISVRESLFGSPS